MMMAKDMTINEYANAIAEKINGKSCPVEKTNGTLARVSSAMRINYFEDRSIIKEWKKVLKESKQ